MSATRDGKMWRCQFYYKDWQGISHKKNKRGFKTKAEAEQWERDFLQQQQKDLDINFENYVEIYYEDMEHRLRENTMRTKKFIIDLKIIPYFKKKRMCDIKASDIRAWQNMLMKKGYSETYLKTVNNQLSAIFNYAVRYYDLKDNPCRKAGSIGKSHAGEREFWTKQEFKQLGNIAEEYGCAIILIGHMNKASGSKSTYRGLGSIDFQATARSVLVVGRIKDDTTLRVIAHDKSSLAPEGTSIAFRMDKEKCFTWEGAYDITVEELLSGESRGQKTKDAKSFLAEILAEGQMSIGANLSGV